MVVVCESAKINKSRKLKRTCGHSGNYASLFFVSGNKKMKLDKFANKFYSLNGKLHREDGPAVEWNNGDKYWFKNGDYHRKDGPAIEYANGSKEWYKNGLRHREDGPAIEYIDGTKSWYLKGIHYGFNHIFTNKSWIKFVKTLIFS